MVRLIRAMSRRRSRKNRFRKKQFRFLQNAMPRRQTVKISAQPLKLLVLGLFLLGFAIALLKLLLPFLLLGGIAYGGWKVWQRRQQRVQEQEAARQAREKQLDVAFYRLVKQHRGELSALDFALETHCSAEVARQFLDRKAIEFDAQFRTTPEGQVLYCFYSREILSQPSK